jgi:hypothetical protein
MAELQQTQTLPAPFLEALGKTYGEQLTSAIGGLKDLDVSKIYGPQFVAPQSALQEQAQGLAGGLGAYQPYLQAAQAATGPTAYQQYMSPYQQAVIDTTMQEYDIQAQKGLPSLAAAAIQSGAYGGGREGVQRAEYQSTSDRNRAALFAQLQQQGFGQAQQLAQQNLANQMNLASASPGFVGQQIAGLQTLGAGETSQQQALLEAQRQLAQQQAYQPLNVAERYGAGIQPLIAGQPGGLGYSTVKSEPTPSPLTNLLGIGSTLAGIYALTRPR